MPVVFATDEGTRTGQLTIAPGAAGVNTFTLDVAGAPLPDGAEGVLRFALPAQNIGEQELRLPQVAPNHFATEGSELALAGDWRITAIVRTIGAFSWTTEARVTVGEAPPPAARTQSRTTLWFRRHRGHGGAGHRAGGAGGRGTGP